MERGRVAALLGLGGGFDGFGFAAEDPGDDDGDAIQSAQWDGEQQLAHWVGWGEHCGDDERHDDEVAEELDQLLVGTMPANERKNESTGSSNATPNAISMCVTKSM